VAEPRSTLAAAAALALAAAVSLGLARFSYALLLPPMREDLLWSYTVAGSMNTVNAAGYLVGALAMPALLRRWDARSLLLIGGVGAAALLALHGVVHSEALLLMLRAGTGVASALSFVAGGLLAARLAAQQSALPGDGGGGVSAGLVLGLYYGGTGLGIVASAALVPPLVEVAAAHWPRAWWALGAVCAAFTVVTAFGTQALHSPPASQAAPVPVALRRLAFGLLGYTMFGLGYIGYMTFVITLLREQGLPAGQRQLFYMLLGAGVVASSWLWAPLLQRWRGGGTLALLNGLLALATVLPLLPLWLNGSVAIVATYASGLLFGAVFLQVVASTTALVRHNLPAAAWPAGISAFTIVFAAGQIAGPLLVGWVADAGGGSGGGGLLRGFALSALVLALGGLLASRQRPLH
jgi:predicted MFS family arabinose efflux permease